MTIDVTEKLDSRELSTGDSPSSTRRYYITGTYEEASARQAMVDFAPTTIDSGDGTHIPKMFRVDPVHIDENNDASCLWAGEVTYGPYQRVIFPVRTTGENTINFDTGGGTQHISVPIARTHTYAKSGTTAPASYGIGDDGRGIAGVDITVPVFNFSETHYLPNSTVDAAYRVALFGLTGRTNSSAFKGFAAGECLFLGASGSQRGDTDWEVTFKFSGSPNQTGLSVGTITGIAKGGWEYLWVRYAGSEDSTAKVVVQDPIAVYVDQVYASGDFAALEIGT